jgi:hypothetical protein
LEVSIENPNPVIVRDSGDFVTLRANILQAQQQLSIADRLAARANAEASNASAAAGALSAKNMSDLAALCDALAFAREDAKRVEYIQTDRVNSYTNSFLHGARSFFGGKDSQTVALQNDRNLAVQRVSSIDRSIRALNCNPAPGGTP